METSIITIKQLVSEAQCLPSSGSCVGLTVSLARIAHDHTECRKRARQAQIFHLFEEAKRQNESSVDAVAKAVSRFETYTKHRDFAVGFKPGHWRSASPIRAIFREPFEAADLPYFNPHIFRNTLVKLGQELC